MRDGMGQLGLRLLTATLKRRIGVGTKKFVFCCDYGTPTLFRNLLKPVWSMALSKHITHYGPWSGSLYYNLTTPHQELYFPLFEDTLSSSVG